MVTLLTETGEHEVTGTEPSTGALWVSANDALRATGWEVKPEGLCKGAVCVPLPAGRERELVRRRPDQPGRALASPRPARGADSERGHAWVLGESARERKAALTSLEAPDFALPDPSGRMHRLSDYRGKKVFLVTWASW